MKVAIQGIQGAFHEEAVAQFYQTEVDIEPCMRFEQLVRQVADETVDRGVIAIENTIAGTLNQNLKLISNSEVRIVGEVNLQIVQHLGALPGTTIDELDEVRSHYMALHQCEEYFSKYPHIRMVEIGDTALGAKQIAEEKLSRIGAVGSLTAIEHYGLSVLASGIETNSANHTRFLVIAPGTTNGNIGADANKCTIYLSLPNVSGSLYRTLGIFEAHNINLTKIESIPIEGQSYHYAFVMDFEFNNTGQYDRVLKEVKKQAELLRVLGVYKSSES